MIYRMVCQAYTQTNHSNQQTRNLQTSLDRINRNAVLNMKNTQKTNMSGSVIVNGCLSVIEIWYVGHVYKSPVNY